MPVSELFLNLFGIAEFKAHDNAPGQLSQEVQIARPVLLDEEVYAHAGIGEGFDCFLKGRPVEFFKLLHIQKRRHVQGQEAAGVNGAHWP
ncbi:hypothetical protein SDC9_164529 [bioreactor metagenome]|uniref:Uncharacterized protein n=1 Tax=bioreactor metagenome TaxID=1076179 RepID=A0A645FUJ0_9ZZZZ